MSELKRPPCKLSYIGTVDQGSEVEISYESPDLIRTLLSIVADPADESLWVEFGDGRIQIPLDLLERAIARAKDEVHSEAWYQVNIYDKLSENSE